GGGGGGSGGGGDFGLGVGFALSPELAQKVRECRGVSSRPMVTDSSSLTFLRGSSDGTVVSSDVTVGSAHGTVSSSHGTVASSHGTFGSSHGIAGSCQGTVGSSHGIVGSSHATTPGGGGDAQPTKKTRQPCNDDNRVPIKTEVDAEKHVSLETLGQRQAGMGQDQGIGDGSEIINGSSRRAGEGGGAGGGEGAGLGTTLAAAASGAAAAVEVAVEVTPPDAPECWEEFDESSLPTPDPVPTPTPAAPTSASAQVEGKDASVSGLALQPSQESVLTSLGGGGVGREGLGGEGGFVPEGAGLSLPVLLVDLARVCGFRVKGVEEAEAVAGKIRAALHESFGDRSEELFAMGSAVHADTSCIVEASAYRTELHRRSAASSVKSSWAVVDYPSEVGGVSVSEAWADVITPSRCGAVEAVRVALAGTNRNLVWKRDMLAQLEAVAAEEGEAKRLRLASEQQDELDDWGTRRREQLERLIEIRPMFERRRAMAEEKLLSASVGVGGGDRASADPVSSAVIQSLDTKLETIDDLIARLEIEEAEEGYGFVPSDIEYITYLV
ncbi:unnamed protein product, partial [Laminaria digitata]